MGAAQSCRAPCPGAKARADGHVPCARHRPAPPGAALTALDGVGRGLQGDDPPAGLGDVHAEHQPHTRVLTPDVRLAFPQLDVRVPQLQDPRAVDAAERRGATDDRPSRGAGGPPQWAIARTIGEPEQPV